jgi:hypothetical protein
MWRSLWGWHGSECGREMSVTDSDNEDNGETGMVLCKTVCSIWRS